VSTQNDARVEAGAFWLFAECAQGVRPEALEAALDAELERVGRELVPPRELERAQRILEAGEAHDSETVTDLAEEVGEFAVDADWRLSLHTVERVRAVSARALRDCARRLLAPERRVVAWCLPKAPPARPKARAPRARRGRR
jgi:predicted Zn-dependent peptidase